MLHLDRPSKSLQQMHAFNQLIHETMVLSTETLSRKYKNEGTGGKKRQTLAKKEHPKAKEKRLRLEAAENRSAQTSKLRSSSANDDRLSSQVTRA